MLLMTASSNSNRLKTHRQLWRRGEYFLARRKVPRLAPRQHRSSTRLYHLPQLRHCSQRTAVRKEPIPTSHLYGPKLSQERPQRFETTIDDCRSRCGRIPWGEILLGNPRPYRQGARRSLEQPCFQRQEPGKESAMLKQRA